MPVLLVSFLTACTGAPDDAPEPPPEAAPDAAAPDAVPDTAEVNAAVRAAITADGMDPSTDRFRTVVLDLDGDGLDDGLALLEGGYCGTGGCTLLVFRGGPDGMALDTRITLVNGPFVVADQRTDGWRDLVLRVSGGGMAAKTVLLQHGPDGYANNPSMIAAAPQETFPGRVVFQRFDEDLARLADFAGRTPQDADLWSRPFLDQRLRQLLYSHYDAFVARMQTVAPVQVENGVYYVTGNMDNQGGSDVAILVADPAHNVLQAWVWQGGELTTFAEAPVTVDLPADVRTMLANMAG